jgi:hypothetical protein
LISYLLRLQFRKKIERHISAVLKLSADKKVIKVNQRNRDNMAFHKASSARYDFRWVFSDDVEDFPCRCCSPLNAMENGQWYCEGLEMSWLIVEELPPSWGDMAEADEANMTAAEQDARNKREATEELERTLALEANRMFRYAEDQKLLNTRGKGKERHIDKVDAPCKFLYCDERAPKSQWTTNAKGERCAPLRKALTGSECWAHEYKHPKTGAILKPHTCKRLHPNEDGWREQWNTDRNYRHEEVADRFTSLRTTAHAAHTARAAGGGGWGPTPKQTDAW